MIVIKTLEISEKNALKVIILSLKKEAKSWYANITKNVNSDSITLKDLREELVRRFSNYLSNEEITKRFLSTRGFSTSEEYKNMLSDANTLFERGCISATSLFQFVISKAPDSIKGIIYEAATKGDWNYFMTRASEVSWIPFNTTNNMYSKSNEVEIYKMYNRRKESNVKRKFYCCEIHGKGNHSSDRCITIAEAKKFGYKLTKINSINAEDEEQHNLNKNINHYSCINKIGNPFYKSIKMNNNYHSALIDTGADISLVDKVAISNHKKITHSNLLVKAANGTDIKIKGKVENLEAEVDEKIKIKFSPFVSEKRLKTYNHWCRCDSKISRIAGNRR